MIVFEYAFMAYPTMVSSLDLPLFQLDMTGKRKKRDKLTSGLDFLHFQHLVVDAGVIFISFADHLTPPVSILCFPLSFDFRAHRKPPPGSRGGSSMKPGETVMA